MSQETDSGPGPLKWVVIIGSVVSGFIWGWMAMFVAFVVIIAVLFMIGSMLQKSNDERLQRRDRQLNDDFRSKYGYDIPPLTDDIRQVFDRMSGQTTTSPSPKKFPKEKKALVEISRNLITTALNADRNWEIARYFLPSDLPGSVLTCETTFLMASILKSVIRDVAPPQIVDECLRTVNDVYTEVFDTGSTNDLPDEMQRIYGDDRLNVIAEKALNEYEEDGDILFLTCPRFISRIASDPLMMGGAAKQIFEEQRNEFKRVFEKHL